MFFGEIETIKLSEYGQPRRISHDGCNEEFFYANDGEFVSFIEHEASIKHIILSIWTEFENDEVPQIDVDFRKWLDDYWSKIDTESQRQKALRTA